jgi:hypothetical protein
MLCVSCVSREYVFVSVCYLWCDRGLDLWVGIDGNKERGGGGEGGVARRETNVIIIKKKIYSEDFRH